MAQPKGTKKETVSNIQSIAYDKETETLKVTFSRGDTYEYNEVPLDVYVGFVAAPSRNTFFKTVIKGKYKFSKK